MSQVDPHHQGRKFSLMASTGALLPQPGRIGATRLRRNSSAESTEESARRLRAHLERQAAELGDDLSRALVAGFVSEEDGAPKTTSGKMGRLTSRGRRRLLAKAQTMQV